MKKIFFLLFFLSIFSSSLHSQEKKFFFSPAVNYQGIFAGELNTLYGKSEYTHGAWAIYGSRFGAEFSYLNDKFLFAPKIGYQASIVLFTFRGSLLSYLQQSRQADWRILMEAGLNFVIGADLCYGYAIPVSGNIGLPSNHRVSFNLNL